MRSNQEVDSCFSEHELMQKISSIPFWRHRIQLGTKIVTPGTQPIQVEKSKIDALPEDLTGKSVLDVGMWDGFYSFECEKRHAKEIIGIDIFQTQKETDHHEKSFQICKEILDSKVNFKKLDVSNIESLDKKFDLILFYGVYYHLTDPFTVLKKLSNICNEILLLEGILLNTNDSVCYLLDKNQIGHNQYNYFIFSPNFVKQYAKLLGFQQIDFLGYSRNDRPIPKNNKSLLKINRGILRLIK